MTRQSFIIVTGRAGTIIQTNRVNGYMFDVVAPDGYQMTFGMYSRKRCYWAVHELGTGIFVTFGTTREAAERIAAGLAERVAAILKQADENPGHHFNEYRKLIADRYKAEAEDLFRPF